LENCKSSHIKAFHSTTKFDTLVIIYNNSKIAKYLDINAPLRFIKCYQGNIIKNPTNSQLCNHMKIENPPFRSNDEKRCGSFRMGWRFKLLSWAHNHVKLHKTRKENNQCSLEPRCAWTSHKAIHIHKTHTMAQTWQRGMNWSFAFINQKARGNVINHCLVHMINIMFNSKVSWTIHIYTTMFIIYYVAC